jgi:hypothetical protein
MKIEKLKPGMRVWSVGKYTVGHTTQKSIAVWPVKIVSVNLESGTVTASWNGNPNKLFLRRTWSKWREKRPLLIKQSFNCHRLATREEIKAQKQNE